MVRVDIMSLPLLVLYFSHVFDCTRDEVIVDSLDLGSEARDATRRDATRQEFNDESEPMYAVVITGKNPHRVGMCEKALASFWNQTYKGPKIIVAVNTGEPLPDRLYEMAQGANKLLEVRGSEDETTTLGDLRNAAYGAIPNGALWVQWDDDDWHHHDYVVQQKHDLDKHGRDTAHISTALWQTMWCTVKNNTKIFGPHPRGLAGSVMTRLQPKYPSLRQGEDSVVQDEYFSKRDAGQTWHNPVHMYVRLIHKWNTGKGVDACGLGQNQWAEGVDNNYLWHVIDQYQSVEH